MKPVDVLIIGGGVVGLTLALELKRRRPTEKIAILEKESVCGAHASGRNSGVLHAGFYYDSDSLKAQLVRDGNRRMLEYCEAKGLRINRCGKVVVARSEQDWGGLEILLARGRANGVSLDVLSERECRRIEPNAKTVGRAIYSPDTSTVDAKEVIRSLARDATRQGIELWTGVRYVGRSEATVRTSAGGVDAGYVVNAAGLYADRIAREFGFARHHRIMPFKGLYLHLPSTVTRTHVYPVPDLRNPFLGVHLTAAVDGHTKIGPTAIPCFWREQYSGLKNLRWGEIGEIAWQGLSMLTTPGAGFGRLAIRELRKYARGALFAGAGELVKSLGPVGDANWGVPGIRAQLVDRRTKRLEMDFVIEADDRSCHVLNAVSPAFTCAFSFADFLADRISGRVQLPVPSVAAAGGTREASRPACPGRGAGGDRP